jgi:hypothetical protein
MHFGGNTPKNPAPDTGYNPILARTRAAQLVVANRPDFQHGFGMVMLPRPATTTPKTVHPPKRRE